VINNKQIFIAISLILISSFISFYLTVVLILISLPIYYQKKLRLLNKNLEKRTKELEESLENFEYLFNNSIETMGLFQDNLCVNLNEAGIKLFGFKNLEDAIGATPFDFIAPESIDVVKNNIINKSTFPYEATAIRQDGTLFPVLIKGQYKDMYGKATRITSLLDLTKLKKNETELKELNNSLEFRVKQEVSKNIEQLEKLQQQSKMVAMGEMIGNIAHQWRQPLASVNNSAILITKKLKKNMCVQKDLDSIETTVQYMSKTIDDFQNFYKEDKNKVKFNTQDIINKTIYIVSDLFKNNQIKIDNDNSDFVLYNYPNELQQVLLVILNNARESIQQHNIKDGMVKIKTTLDKTTNKLYIEICNNGITIKDDIIDKIFEPYFTTKHKSQGIGLGLYMSKMIITQSMDGELIVENMTNGVCFKIILDAEVN